MKYKIKSGSSLEEGKHTGIITGINEVERGEKKYKYLDIFIKVDGQDFEIKYGCPAPKENLNPKSKLGKLLSAFTQLKEDTEMDIEEVLLEKRVSFMTMDKDGFADIIEDSIKPEKV